MDQTIAVIDLGTNTCNLLIAEYTKKEFRISYQGKEVVKLGKGGIDKNQLTEDGLLRAVKAIKNHQERINTYANIKTVVIATSAIRDAVNKDWFAEQIKEATGLKLTIISGDEEAALIFNGVKLAFDHIADYSLILDIGGGSNEFILTWNDEPVWKQSFPLGMARVIEQIPPSDPITPDEIKAINDWFNKNLEPLWEQMKNVQIPQLIGCSGAFDTIADLIDETAPGTKIRIAQEISINDFENIYNRLIYSTTAERIGMKGMESIRVEMIVPSVLFIKLVIERLKIQIIYQTDFALREGVLFERIFS